MQKMYGYMRKAIQEFDLIEDGDKIAACVSGGKDSMVLLAGLAGLKRFLGIDFSICALTLDLQFNNKEEDFSSVQALCDELDVPYFIKRTEIGSIVFDIRKESHPCSLCARMRRGALHDLAKEQGCNKIAFGHHFDDAVETFIMNLFNEGRIGCFKPSTYLSRKDITLIRPMVFAPEKEVIRVAEKCKLPIVKSVCPIDGATNREDTKNFLKEREKVDKGFKDRIFGAMRRGDIDGFGITGKSFKK